MGSHSWRNCWSGCDSIRKRDAPPASAGRLRLMGRGGVRVRPRLPLQREGVGHVPLCRRGQRALWDIKFQSLWGAAVPVGGQKLTQAGPKIRIQEAVPRRPADLTLFPQLPGQVEPPPPVAGEAGSCRQRDSLRQGPDIPHPYPERAAVSMDLLRIQADTQAVLVLKQDPALQVGLPGMEWMGLLPAAGQVQTGMPVERAAPPAAPDLRQMLIIPVQPPSAPPSVPDLRTDQSVLQHRLPLQRQRLPLLLPQDRPVRLLFLRRLHAYPSRFWSILCADRKIRARGDDLCLLSRGSVLQ